MPDVSDPAPDFTLPGTGDATLRLSDLRGSAVVLFFYPRDDTPGCTAESIAFSEAAQEFAGLNVQVFGISRDGLESHGKFARKHGLSVTLLSDAEGRTCEDYGVWVEKKMYGRSFMGIERSTFLIDVQGRIARIWRRVRVPGHMAEVLAAARALQDGTTAKT